MNKSAPVYRCDIHPAPGHILVSDADPKIRGPLLDHPLFREHRYRPVVVKLSGDSTFKDGQLLAVRTACLNAIRRGATHIIPTGDVVAVIDSRYSVECPPSTSNQQDPVTPEKTVIPDSVREKMQRVDAKELVLGCRDFRFWNIDGFYIFEHCGLGVERVVFTKPRNIYDTPGTWKVVEVYDTAGNGVNATVVGSAMYYLNQEYGRNFEDKPATEHTNCADNPNHVTLIH